MVSVDQGVSDSSPASAREHQDDKTGLASLLGFWLIDCEVAEVQQVMDWLKRVETWLLGLSKLVSSCDAG